MRQVPAALCALFLAAPAVAQPEPDAGRVVDLLRPCTACHGPSGASTSPDVPHLDGQLAAYLIESMQLLRQGQRRSTVADHVPGDWSTVDIRVAAAYYSAAKPQRDPEVGDPRLAALGQQIFFARCETCHESNGRTTDSRGAGAPVLAGQRARYIAAQLRAYMSGSRRFWLPMKEAAFLGKPLFVNGATVGGDSGRLGDSEIEALADFLSTVPPVEMRARRRSR